jgi:CRP-like cAMP-binding protein
MADADPELGRLIREMSFKAMLRMQTRVLVLGKTTAVDKVVAFLIELAGRLSSHPIEVIVLPMSRYDIADYLAISAETVSRALTELRRRRLIRLSATRRICLLDRDGLENGLGRKAAA